MVWTYRFNVQFWSVSHRIWLEAFNLVGDAFVCAEKVWQCNDDRDAVLTTRQIKDAIHGASLLCQFLVFFHAETLVVRICAFASQHLVRCGEYVRRDAFVLRLLLEGHVERSKQGKE